MRYLLLILLLLTISTALALPRDWTEYYFSFRIKDRTELSTLTKIISIDNVKGNTVWAYANDDEWAAFQKLGYSATLLPHPGSLIDPPMSRTPEQLRDWTSYPTYDAYVSAMYNFAATYPNFCQIYDIGTTPGGRKLLFAKISDNVSLHEAEPEVFYTSTMHGDETTGYILMLRLIDTLLSQYATNNRIRNLVDNLEIWINPLANPDGTYYGGNSSVSGARRYNLAGYDLNRNYPDPDGTLHPDGYPYGAETNMMMNFANNRRIVLSANFHGGAEVVNYPWDTWSTLHVDNTWFINISRAYATSAQNNSPAGYLDDLNNGITNGWVWYEVNGSRQDWMTYYKNGREVTIELSNTKLLPASQLNAHWNYNYDALLGYLENALYGIQGIVTNALGQPLNATIRVLGHDNNQSVAVTDPVNGDYCRFLAPGSYNLEVSAAGYPTRTFNNIAVTANQKTLLNVVLGESSQNVSLSTGWNLVSFNVLPLNLTIPQVFSSIQSNLQQVKDTRFSYSPDVASWFNNLSQLSVGTGYWLKVNAPCVWTITGSRINPSQNSIALESGWNLVTYLPNLDLSVSAALASIAPYLQEVRYLEQVYVPRNGGNTLSQMSPGKGYWIKVSAPCTLTYPSP